MGKQLWIVGAGVALLTGAAWLLLDPRTAQPQRGGVVLAPGAAERAARLPVAPPSAAAAPAAPAAAAAPAGTAAAAQLFEVDLAGRLVVDDKTVRVLQQLVAPAGGEPAAPDMATLEQSLRRTYPPAAAAQALEIIDRYRRYLVELNQLAAQQPEPQTWPEAERLLAERDALRRRHFDEAVRQGLFGKLDAQERPQLQAMFIQSDPRLSAAEKRRQLAALRAKPPAPN